MLYAILCYHDEDFVGSWSREQDEAVMKKLAVVQEKLTSQGRLGPGGAVAADDGGGDLAQGGPAAGARRPLCRDQGAAARLLHRRLQNLDEALDVARDLGAANPGGAYEVRPVGVFRPGGISA